MWQAESLKYRHYVQDCHSKFRKAGNCDCVARLQRPHSVHKSGILLKMFDIVCVLSTQLSSTKKDKQIKTTLATLRGVGPMQSIGEMQKCVTGDNATFCQITLDICYKCYCCSAVITTVGTVLPLLLNSFFNITDTCMCEPSVLNLWNCLRRSCSCWSQ